MIPAYLKEIAREVKVEGGKSTMMLACPCGSKLFWAYENKLTPDEKKQMEPYENALKELSSSWFGCGGTVDKDGTVRRWKYILPFIKKEVFVPPIPAFANVMSIRAECSQCGRIHTIFDNRLHGYDGVFCNENMDLNYMPNHQKIVTKLPRKIKIVVENDETLEKFRENTGLDCDEADYSNAFQWIGIYTVDEKGNLRYVLDYD